jgi:hypothetical protein
MLLYICHDYRNNFQADTKLQSIIRISDGAGHVIYLVRQACRTNPTLFSEVSPSDRTSIGLSTTSMVRQDLGQLVSGRDLKPPEMTHFNLLPTSCFGQNPSKLPRSHH